METDFASTAKVALQKTLANLLNLWSIDVPQKKQRLCKNAPCQS